MKLTFSALCLLIAIPLLSQIDTMEFQPGYPTIHSTAIEQLQSFASPRYAPGNSFIRLFNWMNSKFMAGAAQPGISEESAVKNAMLIQEELAIHWNYFITMQNANMWANEKAYNAPNSISHAYAELANRHPELPLALTMFWVQLLPKATGFPDQDNTPNIHRLTYPDSFYIRDSNDKILPRKVLNFAAPDSIFIRDGLVQKKCIQNMLSHLNRPINFINENGEEPPRAYPPSTLSGDKTMISDKNKSGISDWKIYSSQRKTHMRQLYSSQFMSLPELKNTYFSIYCVEGGPIDRFDWNTSKVSCTKIKGNYYSTPDFYPRTPDNWKLWKGAWHGWKWINDGRKTEIASGDRFFSPFISPGWSYDPAIDMRPAQWLGLLKCLSAVGAEFFYTGYFNLSKPYSLPENYTWQAVMPAYAQAVTTHYSDIFFKGNVLFDEKNNPIVTYPVDEADVLVTVRKQDGKERYVIAGTVQPSSNTGRFPLDKNIEITVAGTRIRLNVRRQGSVYIYDKTGGKTLFYQLDRWHQYEHPSRWRKEWITEAEVFDSSSGAPNEIISSVYIDNTNELDMSMSESYIQLNKNQWASYEISKRDLERAGKNLYLAVYIKAKDKVKLNAVIGNNTFSLNSGKSDKWQWVVIPVTFNANMPDESELRLLSLSEEVLIDKLVISGSGKVPDLKNY
jgi:hypothetical protein